MNSFVQSAPSPPVLNRCKLLLAIAHCYCFGLYAFVLCLYAGLFGLYTSLFCLYQGLIHS